VSGVVAFVQTEMLHRHFQRAVPLLLLLPRGLRTSVGIRMHAGDEGRAAKALVPVTAIHGDAEGRDNRECGAEFGRAADGDGCHSYCCYRRALCILWACGVITTLQLAKG
jgi:hypothetical protein